MAATYSNWKLGTTYSFGTLAPGVIPSRYAGIKLISISSYAAASRIAGASLYVQWRQIFPKLPQGTIDDPETAEWLVFESSEGEVIVLANNWISESTVTASDYTQATITVTETSRQQIDVLASFMTKLGMKFDVKFN